MMTLIMAAILGALCILCIALAVKKHSSTGKTPVFTIALALIFALSFALLSPFLLSVTSQFHRLRFSVLTSSKSTTLNHRFAKFYI